MGMSSHGKVNEIGVAQIYLRHTAGAFHHNRVIARCQAVEGGIDLGAEVNVRSASAPIVVGILVADGFAVEHHLRSVVALWLEQQRVHIGVARYARGFGLNSLSTAYLKPVGGGK